MIAGIPLDIFILLSAFLLDWFLGDPRKLPHLIVGYGRVIHFSESVLNMGFGRFLKGALITSLLVIISFVVPYLVLQKIIELGYPVLYFAISTVLLFYCLANRTLIDEGRKVFDVLEKQGLEAGRRQVSFIVGRETNSLTENEVKTATLETVSENLSDGVIAPLFYFVLFGVPGAMAYKMINTLDSMIGYRSERHEQFGKFAARLDDIANFIPARLTALLMLASQSKIDGLDFVHREAVKHKSPNAGYPEAALAYILNCRFGGPSYYNGELVEKAYIGTSARDFDYKDILAATKINLSVSIIFVFMAFLLILHVI